MFKSKIFVMSFVAVLGSALFGLMLSNSSNAANPESVVVQVAFVAPIIVDPEDNALEFGSLDEAMLVGETVTVNPDNSFSDPQSNIVGGTQASAKLDATATPGRPINILVDLVSPGAHYTLATWLCDYDGGGQGACDIGGLSATSVASPTQIRIGATLTALATVTAGDFNGTFNVTVSYE